MYVWKGINIDICFVKYLQACYSIVEWYFSKSNVQVIANLQNIIMLTASGIGQYWYF